MGDSPKYDNNIMETSEANPIIESSVPPTIPADALLDRAASEKISAPEPPRWRFVNEAKKSMGYSSLHAGSYIKGRSSNELGAKYVAPDISLYSRKEEKVQPKQIEFQLATNKSLINEDIEVGKLVVSIPSQNVFPNQNIEVGKLQINEASPNKKQLPSGRFAGLPKFEAQQQKSRNPFKEWDTTLHVGPNKEREHVWHDGNVRDSYTIPNSEVSSKTHGEVGELKFRGPGSGEEAFLGEISKSSRDGDNGGDNYSKDSDGDMREGALFINSNGSTNNENNKDIDGSTALTEPVDEYSKTKHRCLYLLLLLLLAVVVILGVLLGKKDEDEVATAKGAVGGLFIPPFVAVNETTLPSSYPSVSPTNEPSLQPSTAPSMKCPLGTKPLSINYLQESEHSLSTTIKHATWKINDACSGEVFAQCLPCSLGSLVLPRINTSVAQSRSNGQENLLKNITECLPINNEYVVEVLPAKDSQSCCGFDPIASIISYDNVVIEYRALDDNLFGESTNNIYFGDRETPCGSESPSASPTINASAIPSLHPSEKPSSTPSSSPSFTPTLTPTTSTPTKSPVLFLGGCPEAFVPLSYYTIGTQTELNSIIYNCISFSCGSYGFEPGSSTSSLWRQGWEVAGSCSGTMAPTSYPMTPPTPSPSVSPTVFPTGQPTSMPIAGPTNSPSRSPTLGPSKAPSPIPSNFPTLRPSEVPSKAPTPSPSPAPTLRERTRQPINRPTPQPTCSTEQEFNLCLAIDMSGSVCNAGTGAECLGCRAPFLPIFFNSECRDSFVSEDTCCNNFANIKEFASLMVNLLGDFPADKSFSVVQFSTNAQLVSGLASAEQTVPVIDQLDYTGGLTNHASAIQICQQTLPSEDNRKKFIMLVTDGVSSEPGVDPEGAAEAAATSAKSDGTFIIPVFISPNNDWSALSFMRRLSSDGEVFDATDFDSLNSLQDRLINQVSCS